MAFRIVAVLSVLVVLAQGSPLPSAGQVSTVGSRNSGVASSGYGGISAASPGRYRPVSGSAGPQPQRPVTAHGSVLPAPAAATTRRVSGSRNPALPVAAPRQQASGSYQRAAAGPAIAGRPRLTAAPVSPIRQPQVASGSIQKNRHQKPY
ncbi:translation initiation factor IF-2 [Drosophila pseudoobscura]|uniref:Translation initiation factor IF-2 n=1 Tax=Drosophila pseudoobscura pseudoobscura TaxID=46245 RepID=A0A6I8WDY8_DROPS|nr:translation initiation factor IF-2 [Drosophila pseudoobscura]